MADDPIQQRVITLLLDALRPFAMAADHPGTERSVDDAFIWEPRDPMRRPLVTLGHCRDARTALLAYGQLTDSSCKPSVTTRGGAYEAKSSPDVKMESACRAPP